MRSPGAVQVDYEGQQHTYFHLGFLVLRFLVEDLTGIGTFFVGFLFGSVFTLCCVGEADLLLLDDMLEWTRELFELGGV